MPRRPVLIRARGHVPLARDATFALLADLDRHRELTDAGMTILSLDGPAGARTGGTVVLHGPAGLTRRARTRVDGAHPPGWMHGRAVTTDGTEAALEWLLEPRGGGTDVEVRMHVAPVGWRDRWLLAAGGRLWLSRRLRTALGRLDALAASDAETRGGACARRAGLRPPLDNPGRRPQGGRTVATFGG